MTHFDAVEHRRPLPLVELENLKDLLQPLVARLRPVRGMVRTGAEPVFVTLCSDSAHLKQFFEGNWGGGAVEEIGQPPEATIVAVREVSADARWMVPGVRYIDPERRLIACAGSEYYGNIKVSVRGLCSSAAARRGTGGFLHGASMMIDGRGVVVCGASGAGKTTFTRALIETGVGVRIVNDDWGWADQDSRSIVFTGEPRLHMKYRSVAAVAPALDVCPERYASENYADSKEDPHARLLIAREEVFGSGVADVAPFDALVVIFRDQAKPFFVRRLDERDLGVLELAEYSEFYKRHEHFMDGSLLLVDEADTERERARFRRLLSQIPAIAVNNVATPRRLAEQVIAHLPSVVSC